MKINKELNTLIVNAVNAGICADIPDRMYDNDNFHAEFIYSSTNGYNLEKTIEFIANQIFYFNQPSKHHSHQK